MYRDFLSNRAHSAAILCAKDGGAKNLRNAYNYLLIRQLLCAHTYPPSIALPEVGQCLSFMFELAFRKWKRSELAHTNTDYLLR